MKWGCRMWWERNCQTRLNDQRRLLFVTRTSPGRHMFDTSSRQPVPRLASQGGISTHAQFTTSAAFHPRRCHFLIPKAELGSTPVPGVTGRASRPAPLARARPGKFGTILCIQGFPRGRGKRHARRVRFPIQSACLTASRGFLGGLVQNCVEDAHRHLLERQWFHRIRRAALR